MSLQQPGRPISQPPPNKLATVWWFVRRPDMWPHMIALARQRISPTARLLEETGTEARDWGESLAVGWRDALSDLFGEGSWEPVEAIHAEEFAEARRIAEAIPGGMGGAAELNLLYHLVRAANASRVVETGVAYGWSSLTILLAQRELGDGALASTDMPYPRANNEAWVGCVVPQELRAGWTLIRRPDRPGLNLAIASLGELDLAHHDSDKTYAGRAWAYPRLWDALRPGGLLVSDDIEENVAFRDFAEAIGARPLVVSGERKLIGILRKPEER